MPNYGRGSKIASIAPGFEEVIAAPAPSEVRIVGQSPDPTAYASGAFSRFSFGETRYPIETGHKDTEDIHEPSLNYIMYVSISFVVLSAGKTFDRTAEAS